MKRTDGNVGVSLLDVVMVEVWMVVLVTKAGIVVVPIEEKVEVLHSMTRTGYDAGVFTQNTVPFLT